MKRTKRREFVMNEKEAKELSMKAQKACMSESHLIRLLISGYHTPAAPDGRFYDDLNKLIDVAERMELQAKLVKDSKCSNALTEISEEIFTLCSEIRRRYLRGERDHIQWL